MSWKIKSNYITLKKLHFKHIKVIAKINNVKGFYFDTGASTTFIEQRFKRKIQT